MRMMKALFFGTVISVLKRMSKRFCHFFRCGPCKVIAPEFAKLAEEYPSVKFLKVNVDDLDEVASDAQVEAMPSL
jgi:thiol-disulfide isomerase/thioredoxin